MHFDGRKVFFVHKRKAKICKSFSQEKAKIRKKYSLRKGRVLQKYFKYSSIMKKESNCLSCLSGMEKRDFQVQNIYIEHKLHDNVRFDSWALRYLPATATRFSEREELGPAFWGCRLSSAPLRHGFCWSEQLQKPEDNPTYYEQVRSPCQVRIKY